MVPIDRNERILCVSGTYGDRLMVSEFTLSTMGRERLAISRITAVGGKFEWIVWLISQCFCAATREGNRVAGMHARNALLGVVCLGLGILNFVLGSIKVICELIFPPASLGRKFQ